MGDGVEFRPMCMYFFNKHAFNIGKQRALLESMYVNAKICVCFCAWRIESQERNKTSVADKGK